MRSFQFFTLSIRTHPLSLRLLRALCLVAIRSVTHENTLENWKRGEADVPCIFSFFFAARVSFGDDVKVVIRGGKWTA